MTSFGITFLCRFDTMFDNLGFLLASFWDSSKVRFNIISNHPLFACIAIFDNVWQMVFVFSVSFNLFADTRYFYVLVCFIMRTSYFFLHSVYFWVLDNLYSHMFKSVFGVFYILQFLFYIRSIYGHVQAGEETLVERPWRYVWVRWDG